MNYDFQSKSSLDIQQNTPHNRLIKDYFWWKFGKIKYSFFGFCQKKDFLEIPLYTTKFNSSGTLSNSG